MTTLTPAQVDPSRQPLNGRKLHPLSRHAIQVLHDLPLPAQEVNPGVVRRLMAERLAEIAQRRSPYAKHNDGNCDHLVRTEAGRAALEALEE